jgi:hypothetical protein
MAACAGDALPFAMTDSPVLTVRDRSLIWLAGLAFVSWLAYLAIALSAQSLHDTGSGRHSLLGLLALFGFAFGCYLVAIHIALRAPQTRRLLGLIVGAAILFRVTLLFSNAIEEVDLYRYLWDGVAIKHGVSPYRYTPQQVLAASDDGSLPDDLAKLVRLRDSSAEMTMILKRVHFGELPTIYPPVSQAMFALCAWFTPSSASLFTRMLLMKACFVGCDLLTLFLVIRLLALTGRPPGAVLIYAWCPLLIKEIANSGHLDALAFCLTTAAVYLSARVVFSPEHLRSPQRTAIFSASLLALAAGAKLYPIVLAPLVAAAVIRRRGWRFAFLPALTFGLLSAILAWPMWPRTPATGEVTQTDFDPAQVAIRADDAPPAPPQEIDSNPHDPSQSLRAFLSEWEMNDFLFLLVVENLRPTAGRAPGETAWFSVVPESWRTALASRTASHLSVDAARLPFILARAFTSASFVLIALWLAWRGSTAETAAAWLDTVFLTVAWFWLLVPTQNPWYWTWALPFLPFARSRAWLAMGGLAFLYYFRFWLMQHFPEVPLAGTGYAGPLFFDYVVVWVEFAPWFAWLAWERIMRP